MNRQRHPNTPYIKAIRPMVKDDIEALRQPSARVRLAKLRDVHHQMARMVVSGMTITDIAAEVGYSVTRVSVIKGSPAFEELVARYRGDAHESWKRSNDKVYDMILDAEAKAWRSILDDLEDNIEEMPTLTKLKIADSASDRVGHHRKSTKENINVNFAANLEAAIARSRQVKYIDHES